MNRFNIDVRHIAVNMLMFSHIKHGIFRIINVADLAFC